MSAAPSPTSSASTGHVVTAGVVTGLVGWTSSFAVVLAGLSAVGASPDQAASGLMVVSVTMGLGCVLFSWRLRMPVTMAWSTPGAALLASATVPDRGFAGAVAAVVVAGVLLAACGLLRPLGRLVRAIPLPLANAMLAGVLLGLCVVPVQTFAADPAVVGPVLVAWAVLLRVSPRWAVPGALVAALVVMGVRGDFADVGAPAVPELLAVAPAWDPAAVVALGLPLFLVTMTSQNLAGLAVLATYGYRPRLGPPLVYSGTATAGGALLGGVPVNLAAISAALAASPEAHPDPGRRWVAGVSCGVTYLAFGPLSGMLTEVVAAAPEGLIASVAGLALVAALAGAAAGAFAEPGHRVAAAVTFLVAASGVSVLGIGGAFWGLVAGGLLWVVLGVDRDRSSAGQDASSAR